MDHIERTVTLPTDTAEAWELLTDPHELAAWLGDDVVLDPSPGAAGRVVERDGTRRSLLVEYVDEPRHLAWRWWPEGDDPTRGSRVDITLTPTGDGTVVRVVERRLDALPDPKLSATASARPAGDAWSLRLLHLERLLLVAAAPG